jgi:hypothetical protein
VTIIHHPDIRRMLMLMKSYIEAMRATAYTASAALDFAENAEDPQTRAHYQARVDLLTPVVKGWTTEVAQELTSLGVQIHGGMGFIEETGAAQHYRDARITTIYEGTTGIQAMDLVGRKTVRDSGKAQGELIAEIRADIERLNVAGVAVQDLSAALTKGVGALEAAVKWLLENYLADQNAPGSVAFDLLMLEGTVIGGWQCARSALVALEKLAAGDQERSFYEGKLATARFYAHHALPRAEGYLQAVLGGSEPVMALNEEQF